MGSSHAAYEMLMAVWKSFAVLGVLASVVLSGCSTSGNGASDETEQGLFVVTAGSVSVDDSSDGSLAITLGDVEPRAMWFTDRPERLADVVLVTDLIAAWTELGFTEVPPNAGLVLSDSDDEATLIITVVEPTWSPSERTLRMTGLPIATADLPGDHALGAHTDRVVNTLPTDVEHVALFIDPATIPPEFQALPANCVSVPHVGGPGDPLGTDACIPMADLPDFDANVDVPAVPAPDLDDEDPPRPLEQMESNTHGDTLIGPSITEDIGG